MTADPCRLTDRTQLRAVLGVFKTLPLSYREPESLTFSVFCPTCRQSRTPNSTQK